MTMQSKIFFLLVLIASCGGNTPLSELSSFVEAMNGSATTTAYSRENLKKAKPLLPPLLFFRSKMSEYKEPMVTIRHSQRKIIPGEQHTKTLVPLRSRQRRLLEYSNSNDSVDNDDKPPSSAPKTNKSSSPSSSSTTSSSLWYLWLVVSFSCFLATLVSLVLIIHFLQQCRKNNDNNHCESIKKSSKHLHDDETGIIPNTSTLDEFADGTSSVSSDSCCSEEEQQYELSMARGRSMASCNNYGIALPRNLLPSTMVCENSHHNDLSTIASSTAGGSYRKNWSSSSEQQHDFDCWSWSVGCAEALVVDMDAAAFGGSKSSSLSLRSRDSHRDLSSSPSRSPQGSVKNSTPIIKPVNEKEYDSNDDDDKFEAIEIIQDGRVMFAI